MAINKILDEDLLDIATTDLVDWSEFENKKIFLTGGTGLLGSLLVRAIQYRNKKFNSNINLVLLVRDINKGKDLFGEDNNIFYIEGSVEDFHVERMSIDYIIHAASPTKSKYFIEKPVETLATAVIGTQRVLELARICDIKSMIYLSSMEMYGTMEADCVKETDLGFVDLTNVRSCYPVGKRTSEMFSQCYLHEYGVPVKIARIAQTYGAGIDVVNENRVYKVFADSIINKKNIVLKSKGGTIINYCYTTDVIKGLLCILQKGINGQAYNVVGDKSGMTILESAEWLASELGNGEVSVEINIPEENAGFAPDNKMVLDNGLLCNLGWMPSYDVKSGYRRLIDYMRVQYEINAQNSDKVKRL